MNPSQQLAHDAIQRAIERKCNYDLVQQVSKMLVDRIGVGGDDQRFAECFAADLCEWSVQKSVEGN